MDKIKAVQEAPKPQDMSQLRSFIGLVNHYNKFLPDAEEVGHDVCLRYYHMTLVCIMSVEHSREHQSVTHG